MAWFPSLTQPYTQQPIGSFLLRGHKTFYSLKSHPGRRNRDLSTDSKHGQPELHTSGISLAANSHLSLLPYIYKSMAEQLPWPLPCPLASGKPANCRLPSPLSFPPNPSSWPAQQEGVSLGLGFPSNLTLVSALSSDFPKKDLRAKYETWPSTRCEADFNPSPAYPATTESEAGLLPLSSLQHRGESTVSLQPGQKKPRNSRSCECFLCAEVLPNRLKLIVHLKKAHGIERSQSLMYKRLNQGEDEIKRLYMKERKSYRLNRR